MRPWLDTVAAEPLAHRNARCKSLGYYWRHARPLAVLIAVASLTTLAGGSNALCRTYKQVSPMAVRETTASPPRGPWRYTIHTANNRTLEHGRTFRAAMRYASHAGVDHLVIDIPRARLSFYFADGAQTTPIPFDTMRAMLDWLQSRRTLADTRVRAAGVQTTVRQLLAAAQ